MAEDSALRELVLGIIANDAAAVARQIAAAPELVRARFSEGATRQEAQAFFLSPIGRYVIVGDSALHFAAAAYRAEMVRHLVRAGADVHAGNRFGDQPLHAAAKGNPNSGMWNPVEQTATIAALIDAGANPNATNMRGVAPLHVAVRTRSAAAVRALLERGADPALTNGNGSTPMLLATRNTGRGGSGSAAAKEQQPEIIRLLEPGALDHR